MIPSVSYSEKERNDKERDESRGRISPRRIYEGEDLRREKFLYTSARRESGKRRDEREGESVVMILLLIENPSSMQNWIQRGWFG